MLREIGLVLFLASVGIKAGAGFWETVAQGDGLLFVLTGFLITIIPILIVGTIARMKYGYYGRQEDQEAVCLQEYPPET